MQRCNTNEVRKADAGLRRDLASQLLGWAAGLDAEMARAPRADETPDNQHGDASDDRDHCDLDADGPYRSVGAWPGRCVS